MKKVFIYNDIVDIPGKESFLKITDLENIFSIYIDKNQNYVFNLNNTLFINVGDKNNLEKYLVNATLHWPTISYMIYGTTRLSWFLMKLNNVTTDDLFQPKEPGDIVYYLDKSYLDQIIKVLNGYQ